MTKSTTALLLPILAAGLFAQETAQPEFDAASVKPSEHAGPIAGPKGTFTHWGCSGGPGWTDPIRYTCTNVGLRHLIETAWGLKSYQLIGPGALDAATYDVAAKVPAGATRNQFQQMLQKLLVDRFHLVVHHEMREQPVYILSIGKDGHKLQPPLPDDRESALDAIDKNPNGDGKAKTGDGSAAARMEKIRAMMDQMEPGRPTRTDLPPGPAPIAFRVVNGVTRMAGRRSNLAGLASALSGMFGCPVFDRTGLAGEWNFLVEFASDSLGGRPMGQPIVSMRDAPNVSTEPSTPTGGQSIFTAFQKQLGLEVKASKEPADTLVVDKVDKTPAAN